MFEPFRLQRLPHRVLKNIPDLPLRGGDAAIKRQPVGMRGGKLGAGERRADLRAVPVRQDNAVAGFDQPDDGRGGIDGVLELFLRRPLLSGPDEGVPAHGHKDELRRISPAEART